MKCCENRPHIGHQLTNWLSWKGGWLSTTLHFHGTSHMGPIS